MCDSLWQIADDTPYAALFGDMPTTAAPMAEMVVRDSQPIVMAQEAARLIRKLQDLGIDLAKDNITSLWRKMEQDAELDNLWREAEPKLQQESGKLMGLWINQFFPADMRPSNHLQVLTQALMRELLYGKPEPVIVLRSGVRTEHRRKIPLSRGDF